jgi:hypothetical protein
MLGNTSLAATAMFASKRSLNHARNTKVGLIILPLRNKFINDSLLLSDALHLWDKSRIISHTCDVEIHSGAEEDRKKEVEKAVAVAFACAQRCRKENCCQPVESR